MLNLDETESRTFQHSAESYGVVVTGGTPTERIKTVRSVMDRSWVCVDCRDVASMAEFLTTFFEQIDTESDSVPDPSILSGIDLRLQEEETDVNLLVVEFDAMPADVRTNVAQQLKGLAESQQFEGALAYTCGEADAVVTAEPDLRARLRTFSLDG